MLVSCLKNVLHAFVGRPFLSHPLQQTKQQETYRMSSSNREELQDHVSSQGQSITSSTMSASNQLPEVSSSFISHYPINTPPTTVTTDMSHFTSQTVQPLPTDQSSPYLTIPNQFGSLSLASPAGSQMDHLYSPTEPTYRPISQLQDQFGIAPTEKSSVSFSNQIIGGTRDVN